MESSVQDLRDSTKPDCDFRALKLHVGSRLQLQLPRVSGDVRHLTSLIGYVPGATLLVKLPVVRGISPIQMESEPVIVRGFSGLKVFAFRSHVKRVCAAPYPYAHIAFPESIKAVQVRKSVRVAVNLPVKAKRGSKPDEIPATLLDVSHTGALVESVEPLGEQGEPVSLSLAVRPAPVEEEAVLRLRGVIRNVRASSGAAPAEAGRYGIKFEQIEARDSLLLQNLILRTIADRPELVI